MLLITNFPNSKISLNLHPHELFLHMKEDTRVFQKCIVFFQNREEAAGQELALMREKTESWDLKIADRPKSVHNGVSEGMAQILKQAERMYASAVMNTKVCEKRVQETRKDFDEAMEEFKTRATDLTLAMKQMDEYREQNSKIFKESVRNM